MTTDARTSRAQRTHPDNKWERVSHAEHLAHVLLPYCPIAIILMAMLTVPAIASAQTPWENSANALHNVFTGTIGRALAPVAIIVGGLMWMFGEGGARRHIAALIMGGGMVLTATAFSQWIFGVA